MNARDRRWRELAKRGGKRRCGGRIRQHSPQHIERNSKNEIVEFLFLPVRRHTHLGGFRSKRLYGRAQLDISATNADVFTSAPVKISERHGWNSHTSGSRR